MARYIDADVFVRLIKEKYRFNDFLSANSAQKIIDNIPTADVQPVVHAHWEEYYGDGKCTSCGFVCGDSFYLGSASFYPNCGAKMDEKVVEE